MRLLLLLISAGIGLVSSVFWLDGVAMPSWAVGVGNLAAAGVSMFVAWYILRLVEHLTRRSD